jgi:hypothetical protein
MGLEAWVRCSCIREGKATPHPLPQLLRFDESGEPTLDGNAMPSDEQWEAHDVWAETACLHRGALVSKSLGNIGHIGRISSVIARLPGEKYSIILNAVVYSGSHTGDWIDAHDAPLLLEEARNLRNDTADAALIDFADGLIELTEASIRTGNPVQF